MVWFLKQLQSLLRQSRIWSITVSLDFCEFKQIKWLILGDVLIGHMSNAFGVHFKMANTTDLMLSSNYTSLLNTPNQFLTIPSLDVKPSGEHAQH